MSHKVQNVQNNCRSLRKCQRANETLKEFLVCEVTTDIDKILFKMSNIFRLQIDFVRENY